MPEINQGWLALIGALMGGSGLKVVEYWLNRSKDKTDSAAEFRNELRGEVTSLRKELREVEDDLDEWRQKYFQLLDEFIGVKNQLKTALIQLGEDAKVKELPQAPVVEVVDNPKED